MIGPDTLARLEAIVDGAGVAPGLEARLAVGVRPRQLCMRTLLVGILLAISDDRAAHLSRVHAALVGLGGDGDDPYAGAVAKRIGAQDLIASLGSDVLASWSLPSGSPQSPWAWR